MEGGDTNNSWFRWAERGGTADGSTPLLANDHWNRVEEDTALLQELGCHTHRMSVEWSRVEPKRGRFNGEALDRYRHELGLLCDRADFIGVNYYTRDVVTFSPSPFRMFGVLSVSDGAQTNDLGWEIYPRGLHSAAEALFSRYGLPLFITENGIADRNDTMRSTFIYDHLREVRSLLDAGVPVERYYHWTLLGNFEWAEGYTAAFGLYACDPQTQQRTLRPSGRFYAEICANRVVHWRNHY